jgi:hypothetical protein
MPLLEDCTSLGFRRGFLHSMASIAEMFAIIVHQEAEWNRNGRGKITRNERAERLIPYLSAVGALQFANRDSSAPTRLAG